MSDTIPLRKSYDLTIQTNFINPDANFLDIFSGLIMGTATVLVIMVLSTCGGATGAYRWQSEDVLATDDQEDIHAINNDASSHLVRRYKRTLTFAEEILMRLVAKARPASSARTRRRNFIIKGDWQSALDSFYAFKPVNVEKRMTVNGVRVIKGRSDNMILTLRSKGGKGDPLLDVTHIERVHEQQRIDRFIFTEQRKPE